MVSIENVVYDINVMLFANNNFDPFKKCQNFILVACLKYLSGVVLFSPGLRCFGAISINHFLSASLTVLQILSHLQPECQHIWLFTVCSHQLTE